LLSLRDFFHLPQVDPYLDRLTHDGPGLILVAGMDARANVDPTKILPSGRAGIFRILVRQILEENSRLQATVVTRSRETFRVSRHLRRRVGFETVTERTGYKDLIPAIAHLRPGLMVVDQFTPENAAEILAAAQSGVRAISQIDTVFRGTEVAREILNWGIPRDRIKGLLWVVAMQRVPMLCQCKCPALPAPEIILAIQQRYPHLKINPTATFYTCGSCSDCDHSGQHNEITAFDFFRSAADYSQTEALEAAPQSSIRATTQDAIPSQTGRSAALPLETYMLGLAEMGHIPLVDLLQIDNDQLHRTYQLLTASECSLATAKTSLERKVIELEAANRVLRNRTEELISLQEMGQTLIGSAALRDLARQVCRQASALCGADRAIFYFLRATEAEVLATQGWEPGRIPLQVRADQVCDPQQGPSPSRFNHWPPGTQLRHPDMEGAKLRAGLRVPLIAQGNPVGALIVHSTTKPRFQPGAVALLQTFANQAAIAIQRTGLIEDLQDKIAQLETAQEGLAQKERLERELELAREVQQAVLPTTFPKVPGYQFAAHNQPARQVGGDFYDVIQLNNTSFGLVIADVSDKGMPAAVYMALTRSLIVAEARRADSPVTVLEKVNELLRELGQARMFVTVFYGIVDIKTHTLTYARAGHDRPILLRANSILELKGEGVFLGFASSDNLHLTEETLDLCLGDRLVLYTDGLIDITSPEGERFDRVGLRALLADVGQLSAQELCETVFDVLFGYQGMADQYDDMTLLVMAVNPKGAGDLTFTPIDSSAAHEIVTWHYEPPYDIYNLEDSPNSIDYALDPTNNYYALRTEDDQLVGFCSFGLDAQVPGGDYRGEALDIGMGIRPALTGQGLGTQFIAAAVRYAQYKYSPSQLRVTIAVFNLRAQRVWQKNGFRPVETFKHNTSDREFVILTKASK
jgi:phosphoserine phosphatase RsbU/P